MVETCVECGAAVGACRLRCRFCRWRACGASCAAKHRAARVAAVCILKRRGRGGSQVICPPPHTPRPAAQTELPSLARSGKHP